MTEIKGDHGEIIYVASLAQIAAQMRHAEADMARVLKFYRFAGYEIVGDEIIIQSEEA